MKKAALLACFSLWLCGVATAGAGPVLCFNYGCAERTAVYFDPQERAALATLLAGARHPAEERELLAQALGRLYRIAGQHTPLGADRAGNYLDAGAEGRMDCIDHASSTTTLLRWLQAEGLLRFHEVLEPARRTRFILQHYSAVIEELPFSPLAEPATVPDHVGLLLFHCDCLEVLQDIPPAPVPPPGNPGARFAVDSWFVDNGEPAVVLPLADWLNGDGPNVQ